MENEIPPVENEIPPVENYFPPVENYFPPVGFHFPPVGFRADESSLGAKTKYLYIPCEWCTALTDFVLEDSVLQTKEAIASLLQTACM